jgi:plastocyanin
MSSLKFAFFVAFAMIVSACGSNNSSPSPVAPTPTPAPVSSPAPAPAPAPTPGSTPVTIGTGASTAGAAAFGMNPLTVATGTTVVWTNADVTAHTATSDGAGVFNTGNIGPNGGSASVTFNTAGTVHYHCAIHPGMVGTIVVQ